MIENDNGGTHPRDVAGRREHRETKPRDHTDCRSMNALTDGYLKTIIEDGGAGDDLVAFIRSLCAKT